MLTQGFSGPGRLGWAGCHNFRLPISATGRASSGLVWIVEKLATRAVPAANYQRAQAWERFIPGSSRADLGISPLLLVPTLLVPAPESFFKLRDRAPPFDPTLLSLSRTMTRVRHSHGTRRFSLTVASFRTWRDWQVYAAWDPAFYIIIRDIGPWTRSGGGIQPRYSGLRVQGTASSPPSTVSTDHGRLGGQGCQSTDVGPAGCFAAN